MAPSAAPRKQHPVGIPSGLHAGGPDVKPCGITRSRTSSAASDAPVGIAHSNLGGNSRFFSGSPPPDGPRRPMPVAQPLPDDFGHVPDSGQIAGDEALSPAHWPDTACLPAGVTRRGPLPRTLRRNTAREGGEERTTSRSPSTDISAHERGPGLAVSSKRNHAGSWTHGASTPEGQVPAAELLSPLRGVLDRYLLRIHPRSSLITPRSLFHFFPSQPTPRPPIPPRFTRAPSGPRIPRKWPPVSPRPTSPRRSSPEETTYVHS